MLNFSVRETIKILTNPQNIYDGVILGLHYMPTKPTAVVSAAIASGFALYFGQPESLLAKGCVVVVTSGFMWASTEITHYIANKLWKKRLAELEKGYQEHKRTSKNIETERQIKELTKKHLDALFAN